MYSCMYCSIRCFDNKVFNITDEEARYMDVQQKLVLEVSYKALEDAGMSMADVSGTDTAVFMGDFFNFCTVLLVSYCFCLLAFCGEIMHTYRYTDIHTYIHTYIHKYVCMYVCMYLRIYIYIYIYM